VDAISSQHSNAVSFAVTDENGPILVGKYAVRPVQGAVQRVAIRSVAFCAGAGDQHDPARAGFNHPDGMAFSIGQPDVPVRTDRNALGSAERRRPRGPAVSGKTGLTCAGHPMDFAGLEIEFEDLVAFPGYEPEAAIAINVDRTGIVERGPNNGRSIGSGAGFARSGEKNHRSTFEGQAADDVTRDFANIEIIIRSKLDAVG